MTVMTAGTTGEVVVEEIEDIKIRRLQAIAEAGE